MPRRPARPVSCVYSPGVSCSWRSPVNFVSFSITTVRAGMLMPTASVSVAKTTLIRPSVKHASTASLNGGTIPAWWAATPASSWAMNWSYAEGLEVVVGQPVEAGVDDAPDARPLGVVGQADPGGEHAARCLVALVAAEDEDDGRQQPALGQQVDDLQP